MSWWRQIDQQTINNESEVLCDEVNVDEDETLSAVKAVPVCLVLIEGEEN